MTTIDPAALYELVPRASVPDLAYLAALAAREGRQTDWDRYEGQLPQDGFWLLGLACRACLNGPCRVTPFGRVGATARAEAGVCGFDAQTMSLAQLAVLVAGGLASIGQQLGGTVPGHATGRSAECPSLLSAAATLLAALVPGCTKAGDLAHAMHAATTAAARCLTAEQPDSMPFRDGRILTGLGHLACGQPRVLAAGGEWTDPTDLAGLVAAARVRSIQIVATASTAGAMEAGVPLVVDRQSAPLLSGSRLVCATIDPVDPPADPGRRLDQLPALQCDQDVPRPIAGQPESCSAARHNPWQGSLEGLFICGSSKVRSALGRGGYHQELARYAIGLGLPVTGLGDGAYYLLPLAGQAGVSVAALAPAVIRLLDHRLWSDSPAQGPGVSSRRTGGGTPPLVAFPEPALAEEIAVALTLAAAGVQVFVGGQLPLTRAAAALLEAEYGHSLTLDAIGSELPPGTAPAGDVIAAGRSWLAASRQTQAGPGTMPAR